MGDGESMSGNGVGLTGYDSTNFLSMGFSLRLEVKRENPSFFTLASMLDSMLIVSPKEDEKWDGFGSSGLEQLKEDIILSMGFPLRWETITFILNASEKPSLFMLVSWTDTKVMISPKEEEKGWGGLIA